MRALIGAWLALHVFVVGAAPVVDALEGHGRTVVAHWEDLSSDHCPPLHDELACQLVQVFGAGALLPAPAAPVATVWALESASLPVAAERAWDAGQRARPSTRGPPAV